MIIKILVVDSHELVRAGIRLILDDIYSDMEIHEASGVEEATLKIRREAEFDVVLVDPAVSGQDDLSVLKQIKGMLACPVVVISAQENPLIKDQAMQYGAGAYIAKSSEAPHIRRELKCIIDQCVDNLMRNPRPVKPSQTVAAHMAGHIPRVELTEDMIGIINNLTRRQKEVLELLAAGKTNKQICAILGLSDSTVKNHVTAILSTLGVNRRAKVALLARKYAIKCA